MTKLISVIDCAIELNSLNCYNRLANHFDAKFNYHYPPRMGVNSLLSVANNTDAYIVFGSISNVSDRLVWHKDLANFLDKELKRDIPVLGICFAHQSMADFYGSKVDKNSNEKYFEGTRDITITEAGFGLKQGEVFKIFTSHGYSISKLSDQFETLGVSEECKHDIIRHKSLPLLSIQAHPEGSRSFVKDLDAKIHEDDIKLALKDGLEFIKRFVNHI